MTRFLWFKARQRVISVKFDPWSSEMLKSVSQQSETGVDRRAFMQTALSTAGVVAAGGAIPALAAPTQSSASETLVQQLYGSFNDRQRSQLCFGFDHKLRSVVDANWHIVKPRVGQVLNGDQRDLVKQIFTSLHSEEFVPSAMKQIEQDNKKGLDDCSVALFGEPGSGKFEFVLTGRHLTRRCDGDSVAGQAFGGPIFYGHAANGFNEDANHTGNVFWHQAVSANKVFDALDGKQRKAALHKTSRYEDGSKTVALKSDINKIDGLPVADMTSDQQGLVRDTLKDLLAPFRAEDVDESMKLIDKNGGVESLRMAFYEAEDVGNDNVWDVWQLESPTMVWYFRGDPHVHTWVKIADGATPSVES